MDAEFLERSQMEITCVRYSIEASSAAIEAYVNRPVSPLHINTLQYLRFYLSSVKLHGYHERSVKSQLD